MVLYWCAPIVRVLEKYVVAVRQHKALVVLSSTNSRSSMVTDPRDRELIHLWRIVVVHELVHKLEHGEAVRIIKTGLL